MANVSYITSLPIDDRKRYIEKIKELGNVCPYSLPEEQWVNDPTQWPEVTYPDIFSYLIETPGNVGL